MAVKPSTTAKPPVKQIVESESEDEDDTDEEEDESEEETESEDDEEDSEEVDSEEEEEKPPPKSVTKNSASKPTSTAPKEQATNEYVKKVEFDEVKQELKVLIEQKIPKLEQKVDNLQILIDKSVIDYQKDGDAVDTKPKTDTVKEKKLTPQTSVQESDQYAMIDEIYAKQKEHSMMLETLLGFMEQYKEEQSMKQKTIVPEENSTQAVDSNSDQTKEIAKPSTNSQPMRPAGLEIVKSDSMVNDLDEESRLLLCSKLIEMRKLSFAELIYQLNQ